MGELNKKVRDVTSVFLTFILTTVASYFNYKSVFRFLERNLFSLYLAATAQTISSLRVKE